MNDRTLTSNEDLIAEFQAAAWKWLLEKNNYTLESLRDARKALLSRMNAPETGERRSLTGLRQGQIDFIHGVTTNAALSGMHKEQFLHEVSLAWDAREHAQKALLEPHPLMTPLPADEAATLREVIGEAPQRGPRLGDPHPPSCACWECCK